MINRPHALRLGASLLALNLLACSTLASSAVCPLPAKPVRNAAEAQAVGNAAMQAYALTTLKAECVQLFVSEPGQGNLDYEVLARENHSPKCGGDPDTSPRIFTLRISARGDIQYYDTPSDQFLPLRCTKNIAIQNRPPAQTGARKSS